MNKLSVVIPVWNQLGYSRICVDYLLKNTVSPYELVIVDNGSDDGTFKYFSELSSKCEVAYIKNNTNLGPIKALNQGIKKASCEIVVTMHNDLIIFEPGWNEKLAGLIERDEKIGLVGLAGRKVVDKRGVVDENSLVHNLKNEDLNPCMKDISHEVAVLDGVFMAARKRVFEEIGFFDEVYGLMHFYDMDISMKSLAAGYSNMIVNIEALHIYNGGVTRKTKSYKALVGNDSKLLDANSRLFFKKWRKYFPLERGV